MEVNEKRYAVLIANSSFPNDSKLQPLRCPENDVDGLSKILSSEELGGFLETVVLKNRTHYEVLNEVGRVFDRAGKDDLVLIYYSGHGKPDLEGHLYLASLNTVTTTINNLTSSSIPVESIKRFIKHSKSRKVVLIFDCCYSGAIGATFTPRGDPSEHLKHVAQTRGTYIITASTGIQVAIEKEGDQYGLLTKHIIEGIQYGTADRDNDGYIGLEELYDYVSERVQEESPQEPMRWSLNVKGKPPVISRAGMNQKLQAHIQQLFEEAKLARKNEAWATVIENVKAIQVLNSNHEAITLLVEAQQQERLADLYSKGLDYFNEGHWNEALNYFEQIINLNNEYKNVSDLKIKAENKILKELLSNDVEQAIADKNWQKAIDKLNEILLLDTNDQLANAKLVFVKQQQKIYALYKKGLEHYRLAQWDLALLCFNQLSNNINEFKNVAVLIEEIKSKKAEEEEKQKQEEQTIKIEFEKKNSEIKKAVEAENWEDAEKRLQELYSLQRANKVSEPSIRADVNQFQLLLAQAKQQQKISLLYSKALAFYESGKLRDAWQYFTQINEKAGDYKETTKFINDIENREITKYIFKINCTLIVAFTLFLIIVVTITLLLNGFVIQSINYLLVTSITSFLFVLYYAYRLRAGSDYWWSDISQLRQTQEKNLLDKPVLKLNEKEMGSSILVEVDKAETLLSSRLNNLLPIDSKKAIDTHYITCAEYQLFIDDTKKQGLSYHPDHWLEPKFPIGIGNQPIRGVRAKDAIKFCTWLTMRQGGNIIYRLPTVEEAIKYPSEDLSIGAWCINGNNYEIVGLPVIKKRIIKYQLSKLNISGPPLPKSLKNNLSINLELNGEVLGTIGRALTFVKFNYDAALQLTQDLVNAIALDIHSDHAHSFIQEVVHSLDLLMPKNIAVLEESLTPFSYAVQKRDYEKLKELAGSFVKRKSNTKPISSLAMLLIGLISISEAKTLLDFRQAQRKYASGILECAYVGYNLLDKALSKPRKYSSLKLKLQSENIIEEERETLKAHQTAIGASFWYLQLVIAREAMMLQSWEGIRIIKELKK